MNATKKIEMHNPAREKKTKNMFDTKGQPVDTCLSSERHSQSYLRYPLFAREQDKNSPQGSTSKRAMDSILGGSSQDLDT